MSDNHTFLDPESRSARPVVLAGGTPLVPVPDESTVEVGRSRWGVNVTLTPRPGPEHPAYPGWPMVEPGAAHAVGELLVDANATGAPLGYLGPEEASLERRLEREIARFAPAGAPPVHAFACRSGTAGLWVLYMAIMYKRFVVDGVHPVTPRLGGAPEILTSALTFEATWTAALKAFARANFVDVDDSGCMNPDEAESMITPATQIIAPTALYDHAPDLRRYSRIGRTRGIDIVLDAAHGPLIRLNGIHAAYYVTGLIISGQESKIVTPGDEYGFIVTTDPVVAAYIAKIRNVGRTPDPAPEWWPAGIGDALGGNERAGEVPALLMGGSLDLYLDWEDRRATELRALRAGLAAHPELPWRMLPEQPGVDGLFYKAFLQWLPELSTNPGAWARIGYQRTMEWLAEELLTEVATCYPTPDNPAAEYHPAVPWAPENLIPNIDPTRYPKARALAASAQLLPHELLARRRGGTQALAAMLKIAHWIDDPEIHDWSTHPTA